MPFNQKVFLSRQIQESSFYTLGKGFLLYTPENPMLEVLAKGIHPQVEEISAGYRTV
jgi:hypothetical protein